MAPSRLSNIINSLSKDATGNRSPASTSGPARGASAVHCCTCAPPISDDTAFESRSELQKSTYPFSMDTFSMTNIPAINFESIFRDDAIDLDPAQKNFLMRTAQDDDRTRAIKIACLFMSEINGLKKAINEKNDSINFCITPAVRKNYKEILKNMFCSPTTETLRNGLPDIVFKQLFSEPYYFPKEWHRPDVKEMILKAISKDARQMRSDLKKQLVESVNTNLRIHDLVHAVVKRLKADVQEDDSVRKRFALLRHLLKDETAADDEEAAVDNEDDYWGDVDKALEELTHTMKTDRSRYEEVLDTVYKGDLEKFTTKSTDFLNSGRKRKWNVGELDTSNIRGSPTEE